MEGGEPLAAFRLPLIGVGPAGGLTSSEHRNATRWADGELAAWNDRTPGTSPAREAWWRDLLSVLRRAVYEVLIAR